MDSEKPLKIYRDIMQNPLLTPTVVGLVNGKPLEDQLAEVQANAKNHGSSTQAQSEPSKAQRPYNPYKRYRFSPAILRKLRSCFEVNNWQGILLVLEDWVAIAIACSSSMWAWQNLSIIPGLSIYLIAIAAIGARQRGLRVNNHASTHKTLAKNKVLNYALGTVFSGWPALQSFSAYDDSHNSVNGHHPNLGTERDGDFVYVLEEGLYQAGRTAENVQHYLWSIPLRTPHYINYLLKHRIWNPQENVQERVIRLTYLAVLTAGILYFGWGLQLLLYWVIPLLTTANWIGAFIELSEHYPMMETAPKVDIYVSRNRLLNPVWNFFIGTHQEGLHQIHHLFPGMPLWRMKEAHKILLEDEVYASLNQEKGFRALLKQMSN